MKKISAVLLALILICSFSIVVSAASTITLTTTVPEEAVPSYTLIIPADQEITYGQTHNFIGKIEAVDASNFSEAKDLKVTANYEAFTSADGTATIPFTLLLDKTGMLGDGDNHVILSGDSFYFKGQADGTLNPLADQYFEYLDIFVLEKDWDKASAGAYSTTITFTAEVIPSEHQSE